MLHKRGAKIKAQVTMSLHMQSALRVRMSKTLLWTYSQSIQWLTFGQVEIALMDSEAPLVIGTGLIVIRILWIKILWVGLQTNLIGQVSLVNGNAFFWGTGEITI